VKRFPSFAGFGLVFLVASCSGGSMATKSTMPPGFEPAPPAGMENLSRKRFFFGHQSVGLNLVEGMSEAAARWGAEFPAVDESRSPGPDGPRFIHAVIGENTDPLGKIRDFESIIRGGIGGNVDIAFMKLCYADIQAGTDVRPIFEFYRDTLSRLAADYPRTTFVHLTVPLLRRDKGLKLVIKRLIGRQVRGHEDNDAREELNDLLRAEYAASGTLFDLALVESAGGDAPRSLRAEYTDDGGHLNATGRLAIGGRLLAFLAAVAD
jgi:hypothetical protein